MVSEEAPSWTRKHLENRRSTLNGPLYRAASGPPERSPLRTYTKSAESSGSGGSDGEERQVGGMTPCAG